MYENKEKHFRYPLARIYRIYYIFKTQAIYILPFLASTMIRHASSWAVFCFTSCNAKISRNDHTSYFLRKTNDYWRLSKWCRYIEYLCMYVSYGTDASTMAVPSCWTRVTRIQIMSLLTPKAGINELVYSKEFNIKSCFSTLVWLVSLISPAKNISSTTVYTWNVESRRHNYHQITLQFMRSNESTFIDSCKCWRVYKKDKNISRRRQGGTIPYKN